MVNSGSFDSDGQGDRNAKTSLTQPHNIPDSTQSSSPVTASVATSCNAGFSQTADSGLPSVAHAIEPTPNKTEFNCDMLVSNFTNLSSIDEESANAQTMDEKNSLCCSLPLEKIQGVLTSYHGPLPKSDDDGGMATAKQPTRKLLCLYCERSFVSANLRQKHVERIHSVKQNRRVSSRRQNQLTVTPCVYCDKLNDTENTLKDLFHHLVNEHSSKYFGCLPCEDRFLTSSLLADHNAIIHQSNTTHTGCNIDVSTSSEKSTFKSPFAVDEAASDEIEEIPVKITRSKMKTKLEEVGKTTKTVQVGNKKKSTKLKELRSKKYSVKSSRIALKRRESKRLQAIAKLTDTQKKKKSRPAEKKNSNTGKAEQANNTKSTEKIKTNQVCINPYPEFDNFYRVKKITDHSIDNLKISSLTFDDVFDKAFFNRITCNIEENLLHHIDGKLFKNEESESRISNFEKVSNVPQEMQNSNSENYGCELSLNAVTPVASLSLNSQFGEDFESQIEYGSKPSKKKSQPRKDEIHYKYFTRRKYQASILEHKENRDLSKLDMWTQFVIKKRQQKMLDDKKSAKEILEYTSGNEYKNKLKREELNRILDRRGPFEDLKEEASKKAALDKLNFASNDNISEDTFTEVREVLNKILNRVFATTDEIDFHGGIEIQLEKSSINRKEDSREIPGYLNLRRSSSLPSEGEIDKSDKIALICSSQETENFELPTNQVRGKNELIELTGEWARCRMYICAACGAKLPNMKYLLDHKSLYHQNVWVQHYEFVGNQSELYRHLSIPALGKVGAVENSVQCKLWKRSDARLCTKCGKQCNSLGELHRHILECGGDWTWMLARKKCKYRPFGAKSRRKRRGLIHRVHNKQKTEPTEKKTYKKTFEGPRQRPSDADTIERMLANLPAKRSTRKLISLQDGIYRARKTTQNIKQNKVKCGKVIYKSSSRNETTEKTINAAPSIAKPQIPKPSSNRRSLRNFNKVLSSRILDTNTNLNVKRKIKALNDRRKTRQSLLTQEIVKDVGNDENVKDTTDDCISLVKPILQVSKKENLKVKDTESSNEISSPKSSPKNIKKKMSVKKLLTGTINIKSFFPVKKKKNKKPFPENLNFPNTENPQMEKGDVKTRSKRKSAELPELEQKKEIPTVKNIQKKSKHETFSTLVRSLSFRKNKLAKKTSQSKTAEIKFNNVNETQTKHTTFDKPDNEELESSENKVALDKISKKRKLKNSFRNVMDKVKKLKIDTISEKCEKSEESKLDPKSHKESAFLEESHREELSAPVHVETVVIPSISETKENTADKSTTAPIAINFPDTNENGDENPPIPETIFKLELSNEKSLQAKGELDFDTQPLTTNFDKYNDIMGKDTDIQTPYEEIATGKPDSIEPISIETSVKPKIVPLISPNMKGKIRKPTRGLNDCIAMLTSKLQQKSVEENSAKESNAFNIPTPQKIPPPFQTSYPLKTECILKIPNYRSQILQPKFEETALDLSTKSLRNTESIEKIESFEKSQDLSDKNNVLKFNDPPLNHLIIPKFSKIFTSVDRIIEEVVENRIQTIVPGIQYRKWNSVDDIIQKVIDEQHFISEIPVRNSVDDIIDFVVECRKTTDINTMGKETPTNFNQNLVQNKEKTVRKIGSVRKSKPKKSPVEVIRPEEKRIEITETSANQYIFLLDKANLVQPPNAVISKNESSKNKNEAKELISLPQAECEIVATENVESPNQEFANEEINDEATKTDNIATNKVDLEDYQNNQVNCSATIDSNLNNAFIDMSPIVVKLEKDTKNKKSTRKLGQNRNRSRSKKSLVGRSKESEKILIESNMDALLAVKEIDSNDILECNPSFSINNENLTTKKDDVKQMCNEDEPYILENKLLSGQQKCPVFSDSEDDIPLATLVKHDENQSDLINQKFEVAKSSSDPVSFIDNENNVNADTKIIENEVNDKSKILQENLTLNKSDEQNKCSDKSDEIQKQYAHYEESGLCDIVSMSDINQTKYFNNTSGNFSTKSECDTTEREINGESTDGRDTSLSIQSTEDTRAKKSEEITKPYAKIDINLQTNTTSEDESKKLSGKNSSLDLTSVEVQINTKKKSGSLTRKTKSILNSLNDLTVNSYTENVVLEGKYNKTKSAKNGINNKIDKNNSRLNCDSNEINKNIKPFFMEKLQSETDFKKIEGVSSSTNTNTLSHDLTSDVGKEFETAESKSVTDDAVINSLTDLETEVSKRKGESQVKSVVLARTTSKINQEKLKMETEPVLVEAIIKLTPNIKAAISKPRGKSKSVKARARRGSIHANDSLLDITITNKQKQMTELVCPDSQLHNLPEIVKQSKNKPKGLKTKVNDKVKSCTDSMSNNTLVDDPHEIKCIATEEEIGGSNRKLHHKTDRNLMMEEDTPLKIIQQDLYNGISALDEHINNDKEIESILCPSETNILDICPNKNNHELICDLKTIKTKKKKNSNRNKGKLSKCKNILNNVNTISQQTNGAILETNTTNKVNDVSDISLEVDNPIHEKVFECDQQPIQDPNEPLLKNLEIALQITDVTKLNFPLSNTKHNILHNETDILHDSKDDFVQSDLKTTQKTQSKSNNKSFINTEFVRDGNGFIRGGDSDYVDNNSKLQIEGVKTNIETINQPDRASRSRFRSIKSKITTSVTTEDFNIADKGTLSTKKLIEELLDSKKEILNSKSKATAICKDEEETRENLHSTLGKIEISLTKIDSDQSHNSYSEIYSATTENTSKECNGNDSQNNIKSKGKLKKSSIKICKRTRKLDRIREASNIGKNKKLFKANEENDIKETVSIATKVATNDLFKENTATNLTDNENTKLTDPIDQILLSNETSENYAHVEPIKIVINKQKTRRKSKSFKKIDLKGQNDLFEDFALVIKKPKRATSIMSLPPPDMFPKDIFPNYLQKPLENSSICSIVNLESKNTEMLTEFDSSVEEMDMELDEIPITTSIIEREANHFLSPVVCSKTDTKSFVESLDRVILKNGNNTEVEKEKAFSTEELFQSPEKDLTLPTEEEEFQYEKKEKSINKQNVDYSDKHDKVHIENTNKNLEDPFECTVQDLTELVSKEEAKINDIESLIPNTEDGDKSVENVIDGLLSNCKVSPPKCDEKKKKQGNKKKKFKANNNNKIISGNTDDLKDINLEFEPMKVLIDNKTSNNSRKNSESITEISSVSRSQNVNDIYQQSKLKDIDSIYAFSESEDFEIEKPIGKPKRSSRKHTKSLSESLNMTDNVLVELDVPLCSVHEYTNNISPSKGNLQSDEKNRNDLLISENISKLNISKRRSRSSNCPEGKFTSAIKENDIIDIQEDRKKSVRSAKVKALEHIHDDALAELTESERNRDLDKNETAKENSNVINEPNKKRVNKRQGRSQKTEKLLDEIKLPCESVAISNTISNNLALDECFQENCPVEEKNEDKKDISKDNKELLDICERGTNQNEITLPPENKTPTLIQETKKKGCKRNKIRKGKKSDKQSIQLTVGHDEASLLHISNDIMGFEELENSIEKELNAGVENSTTKLQNNETLDGSFETEQSERVIVENENNHVTVDDNNQELRRSRRGSRKIASYNENDLIDPLLDEIDGKKKARKKEKSIIEAFENKNQKKFKQSEKKLNNDELFDLLKSSSVESNNIPNSNVFINNTIEVTNSYNQNFENNFENILDSSPLVNIRSETDDFKASRTVDNIYEFADSSENTNPLKDPTLSLDVTKKQNKRGSMPSLKSQEEGNSTSMSVSDTTVNTSLLDTGEVSTDSRSKSLKNVQVGQSEKSNYCEICNKKFMRTDNLVKHKRTLTHIQKLSEIEAKEAAAKLQPHQPIDDSSKTLNSVTETSDSNKAVQNDINIHDILQESDKSNRQESTAEHTSFPNNHSLKLADIINDVLNKPVIESENEKHNFSDIVMQNNGDMQHEFRRYKSLGERKSFDSELLETKQLQVSDSYVSKTTILEKQISLLENIIENQAGVNYIDDISMSSNNSLENNVLVSPSELSLKQDDSNTCSRINLTKPNTNNESFLKPSQYEEISEDSANVRSYEDQKLRKTLNRDEELFLECCSLLKSGSEMSGYSNKKPHNRVLSTMGLKQCDEPEWLERKCLVEKPMYDVANEYSDNSRIPTPLGDSYDDDASNSNTISSNWNMTKTVNVFEDISQDKDGELNKSFSFQEILDEEEDKKSKCSISKFGEILSKTIRILPKALKRTTSPTNCTEEYTERKQDELSDGASNENKKIITKGARKVFEGLKVSIPTEELNLEEVLNCSPKSKKIDITNIEIPIDNDKCVPLTSAKPPRTGRKSKPVKNKSQFGSNLLFKMKKKKVMSPTTTKNKNDDPKSHDIYDFEETQDNTDVFTKPDFRTFRNMKSGNEIVAGPESDTDSRDCVDSFSYEAPSINSSISSSSSKKNKTQENITKKKCMIMGRIFKNAAKSKIEDIDEEIRDIPPLDNCELIENYVAECKKIIRNEEVAKPKLTENEINQLFDQLLEDRLDNQDPKTTEPKNFTKLKFDNKKTDNKKKPRQKNKKRTRTNSESTDDEFNLNKINKKRAYRKNAKAEDNCINLEQELKECIGVASRKSQRKCTSGKQNVLVEYWSSDDSQFEALLESQKVEVKQSNKVLEETKNVVETKPTLEVSTENVSVEINKPVELEIVETKKPKLIEKKSQSKLKSFSQQKLKSGISSSEKISDTAISSNRRKRAAVNPLYHWSSSSEDESQDLIEVKPIRDELEDDEDRPVQHGWIVGDSPKKLVTMLAQAKGKKTDIDCVKEQGKKRTTAVS